MSLHGIMIVVHHLIMGDKRWWSTIYNDWNEYAHSNDIFMIYPQTRMDMKKSFMGF